MRKFSWAMNGTKLKGAEFEWRNYAIDTSASQTLASPLCATASALLIVNRRFDQYKMLLESARIVLPLHASIILTSCEPIDVCLVH